MRRIFVLALLLLGSGCALFQPAGQRFVVFFEGSSVDTDGAPSKIVAAAADYARAHPDKMVAVSGFADPNGTAEVNAQITRGRVENVVALLTKDGVSPTMIARREVGQVPFGLDSQESRRVVITVGSP